jgi:NAD(P)-dependent dehydrogenase (short-subunit alcohol dehydrogenase family)
MALKRPVALVTGASRGIGKAAAIDLAKAGFDVAVSARTLHEGDGRYTDGTVLPGAIDTTVAAIEAAGGQGFGVRMDVLDHASLVDGVAATVAHFGGIDVLVNNGIYQGTGTMVDFLDLDFADLYKIFEGNVFGQLVLIREVLPQMVVRGGGTIINMISATAYRDPPGKIGSGGWGMAYAMSKAAFSRVAPLLEVEHGEEGIRAFSVDPGYVVTETAEARGTGGEFSEHFAVATPPVIGAAIAWLATSPEADEQRGKIVIAQRETKRRGLLPGWPPADWVNPEKAKRAGGS